MVEIVIKYFKKNYNVINHTIYNKDGDEVTYLSVLHYLSDILGCSLTCVHTGLVFYESNEQHFGNTRKLPIKLSSKFIENNTLSENVLVIEQELLISFKKYDEFKVVRSNIDLIDFMGNVLGYNLTPSLFNPTTFEVFKSWVVIDKTNYIINGGNQNIW